MVALVLVALLCIETLGRTHAEIDAQLLLRPQPQLRHLFPSPHAREVGGGGVGGGGGGANGFGGLWGRDRGGGGQGAGARGVTGGPASDVAVEATAAALAAQAWAKLIQHQAAQEDAEEDDQKLSQSM